MLKASSSNRPFNLGILRHLLSMVEYPVTEPPEVWTLHKLSNTPLAWFKKTYGKDWCKRLLNFDTFPSIGEFSVSDIHRAIINATELEKTVDKIYVIQEAAFALKVPEGTFRERLILIENLLDWKSGLEGLKAKTPTEMQALLGNYTIPCQDWLTKSKKLVATDTAIEDDLGLQDPRPPAKFPNLEWPQEDPICGLPQVYLEELGLSNFCSTENEEWDQLWEKVAPLSQELPEKRWCDFFQPVSPPASSESQSQRYSTYTLSSSTPE